MSNKQTKAERREAARAEALALQAKQSQSDRRNRLIVFGALGAAIVALVAVALVIIFNEGQRSSVEDIPVAEVENMPSVARADGGIPVGAGLAAGTENSGAPEVAIYLDYSCPACQSFEQVNAAGIEEMANAEDATFVYYPVGILDAGTRDHSTRAGAAAYWVAENSPEHFFEFNDLLFQRQTSGGMSDAEIADVAVEVGVPADVASGIRNGDARAEYGQLVYSSTNDATSDVSLHGANGFGTPTILVDGERFEQWNQPGALGMVVAGDLPVEDEGAVDEDGDEDA